MFGSSSPKKPVTVISLGGSLIAPEGPDGAFVKTFVEGIRERVAGGRRFIVVTGGGKTARAYQKALVDSDNKEARDSDWIGIYATRLNAELLRLSFGTLAYAQIIEDPRKAVQWNEDVLVAGGWEPGRSTDYDAVVLAKTYGAERIVNVSNVDYIYTADPRTVPDAKPIPETTWAELRKILPQEWKPGLNAPFDPVAAEKAEEFVLTVSAVSGADRGNMFRAIDGEQFTGTTIRP